MLTPVVSLCIFITFCYQHQPHNDILKQKTYLWPLSLNLQYCCYFKTSKRHAQSLVLSSWITDSDSDRNSPNDVELCGLDFIYVTLHIHRLENILQHINTCSCTHTSAGVIPPIVDVDVEDIVLFLWLKHPTCIYILLHNSVMTLL